ncbi:MAG: citrate lyase subunit beta, partial [Deltaproteobacteria bacterium]|nr:citrate lyase subunit beta [Deltaproteobacteria bacterium]
MLSNNKIWRSLLFVPANSWKMLNKSLSQMQDGVIIDLEDACPILEKDAGRKFARDIMPMLKAKGIDVIVRVNSLSTGMTIDDLKIVITEDIDGIMLPNSETKDDIIQLAGLIDEIENARKIKKRTDILPLIESPQGVINAYDIGIASDR